jgi:hypothetical protein
MGQEVYDLIYTQYDQMGNKIDDSEDVFYCEDSDIDTNKVEALKKLLLPVSDAKETLVPLEVAKLLAAWGLDEAVDYFQYCIEIRIDKLGNIEPHRLYGYDVIYEHITASLLQYDARYSDRTEADKIKAFNKINPLILSILRLSKELPYNMSRLLRSIRRKNWRFFEQELKDCFVYFLDKDLKNRNDYLNIIDLKELFENWDPAFLINIENKYGENWGSYRELSKS